MKEIIGSDEVMSRVNGTGYEVELRSTTVLSIGERLAWGIGGLVAVITLGLLAAWFVVVFRAPEQSSKFTTVVLEVFDKVVKGTIIPLLTFVLGYIFGGVQTTNPKRRK